MYVFSRSKLAKRECFSDLGKGMDVRFGRELECGGRGGIGTKAGTCFNNGLLPAIQIRWKRRLAVIMLLVISSQQNFAQATTAQLSCHVQKFVAITVLKSR